ncbi:MAG: cation diffusion facilitator family transporter [Verrucomicrobiota bacterium]
MSADHDHSSSGNLKVAFFLNLGFTILEIIGGFWTNSIAILTDAVHDLADSISLGLAWYFDKISSRGRTARHTYGYRRFRLLGGLITGVMLLAGLGFVLYHAIGRLSNPQEVRAPGMLGLAVLGILFNGAAVLRVKSGTSLTEKLVSWHLIEDTLGWVAVLIGAGIMMIWDVPIVDPILSIGISLIVLWNVGRNLKEVFSVLLQTAPENFDANEFERNALEIEGVQSLHHLHSWSIDGESHVLSAHLVLTSCCEDPASVKTQVRNLVDPLQFEHITLEVEGPEEDCPQSH